MLSVRFFDLGSTWRHYEEVTLPENLIVMADSICSFQPVHGQGMTVAAREAVALDRIITQRNKALSGGEGLELEGLSNQWQQTALPIVKVRGQAHYVSTILQSFLVVDTFVDSLLMVWYGG